MADDLDTFTERRFPRPMRNEWGEGQGEGFPHKNGLLSPTLSSSVPLEEREQAPCALKEEFCLTPPQKRALFNSLKIRRRLSH